MSDARLFRLCLLASLPLTILAFVLLGWFWRPTVLAAPLPTLTHIRLVRLPPPPPKPRPVQVAAAPPPVTAPAPAPRRIPRVLPRPKPHPPKPPRPRKHTRPGARVPKSSAAPLAAPAGGSDAGAPAPSATVAAAPPPRPTPDVLTSRQTASPLVAHNVEAPPTQTPAPSDAGAAPASPTVAPAAAAATVSGTGKGEATEGKGVGAGEGQGIGRGIGAGASEDAGEPFGVGKGLAGDGGPRHVVYVLDVSGSMTSRIDKAESELRHALAGLQPDETFNVVAFSDEARAFDPDMAPATPERKDRADQFLGGLRVDGATNLEAAMRLALSRSGVNEVVLLTDGVPTNDDGPYPPEEFPHIAERIDRMNTQRARISTIGLVGVSPDGKDQSFEAANLLKQIARDSGGVCKLVTLGVAEP